MPVRTVDDEKVQLNAIIASLRSESDSLDVPPNTAVSKLESVLFAPLQGVPGVLCRRMQSPERLCANPPYYVQLALFPAFELV